MTPGHSSLRKQLKTNSTNSRTGPQETLKMHLAYCNSGTNMSLHWNYLSSLAQHPNETKVRQKKNKELVYPGCSLCHASLCSRSSSVSVILYFSYLVFLCFPLITQSSLIFKNLSFVSKKLIPRSLILIILINPSSLWKPEWSLSLSF